MQQWKKYFVFKYSVLKACLEPEVWHTIIGFSGYDRLAIFHTFWDYLFIGKYGINYKGCEKQSPC